MTDPNDSQLLERFGRRLSGIETHVPAPPPWQAPPRRGARVAAARQKPRFGAVRLAAASAIVVALFGGFLSTDPLVRPRSAEPGPGAAADTSATDELLSRMVTEEVEPGVLRVINDGVRDLSWQPEPIPHFPYHYYRNAMGVGPEGVVWLFRPQGSFQLGEAPTHRWDSESQPFRGSVEVTMYEWDGARRPFLYQANGTLRYFGAHGDEDEWGAVGPANAVTVHPTGATWAASQGLGGRITLSHAPAGDGRPWDREWTDQVVPELVEGYVNGLWATDDGAAWLLLEWDGGPVVMNRFWRFDGSRWEPADVPSSDYVSAAVGLDGTVWASWTVSERGPDRASAGPESPVILARYDGDGWTQYTAPEDIPRPGSVHDGAGFFQAAPDGGVWFTAGVDDSMSNDQVQCDGLARFDGSTVTRYLRSLCVYNLDIAPDGTVWALAGADYLIADAPSVETYAIRPGMSARHD